jgi:hypothetical protein
MGSPSGRVYAFDHGLHVSSGFAVLPDRVKTCTSDALPEARHRTAPHVATVPASRTSDTYVPVAARVGAIATGF